MSKVRVSFDLDLTQIAPQLSTQEVNHEGVREVVTSMLLAEARCRAKEELNRIRRDPTIEGDLKIIRMAEQIRKMMFTLMAQANMKIEAIGDDVTIATELPFEAAYQDDKLAA